MPQQFWNVIKDDICIDEVPYDVGCDADYVKRSLIDHDGYDPSIEVYASGVIPDDLLPEYSAEFIPQSELPAKLSECRVKWRVMLRRNSAELITDYSTGIGHLQGYRQGDSSLSHSAAIREACKTGNSNSSHFARMAGYRIKAIPPKLADVLHCLLLDSSVLDAGCFENWAAEFGYDTDSRQAEATYRQCIDIALRLRQLYSDSEQRTLRHVFANY